MRSVFRGLFISLFVCVECEYKVKTSMKINYETTNRALLSRRKKSFKYLRRSARRKLFYYQTEELWECKKGSRRRRRIHFSVVREVKRKIIKINPIKSWDIQVWVGNKKRITKQQQANTIFKRNLLSQSQRFRSRNHPRFYLARHNRRDAQLKAIDGMTQ